MLQENSFFSSPFIFFGENNDEQETDCEEEENFSDPWGVFFEANKSIYALPHIGLFIHWTDINT